MQHQPVFSTELDDGWMAAFIANTRAIESHRLFPHLVREVAIAEAPSRSRFAWLRRNSRTYGAWIDRNRPGGFSDSNEPIILHAGRRHCAYPAGARTQRAYALARRIVLDLDCFTLWPHVREADAAVYVTARWHVQHRSSGRDL